MSNYFTTKTLTLCAFFSALTAILSQIVIPMAPVPINLATFSVFVAGAVLGPKLGAISQLIYVLLGAIGLPVFAGFSGGVGIIVGPTGGYIVGYILAAWLTGFVVNRFGRKTKVLVFSMTLGLLLCYLLGTTWFMLVTKTSLAKSLMLCVVPFLFGDSLKVAGATLITGRIKSLVKLDARIDQ
ncbi:MAG: biotin transporter BioY [Cellulosilyticaceae bacterium]